MFPRLLAISEAGWTPREIKDYSDFLGRLAGFEKRLEQLGVHAASRDCYLQQPRNPWVPQLLKILLSNDHPGSKEYRRFNKTVHL
jgi:N-acetyl-beta-hexosaminidase